MAKPWAEQSLLERAATAVRRVQERMVRAVTALEAHSVPYAIVGDLAVSAWVATVDAAATRNSPDVEILLRRDALNCAERALNRSGFVRSELAGIEIYRDEPMASARDVVRVVIAGEKRESDQRPSPDVSDSQVMNGLRVCGLEPLVRMGLDSFRLVERGNLRDLIDVGLIDARWPVRFPPEVAARLQHLLDTPVA